MPPFDPEPATPPRESEDLGDALIPDVLTGWVACLRAHPDPRLRADQRGVAEQNLLRTLLRAAQSERDDEHALQALTLAASRYGALQPIHRVDPGEVTRQFGCLRGEIARVVARRGAPRDESFALLMRVDAALSVATLAVIRGGHAR
jgi:hypothetical protein